MYSAFLCILLSFQMHENVLEPCFKNENLWIIRCIMYHVACISCDLRSSTQQFLVGAWMWACVFLKCLCLKKKILDYIHEYRLSLRRRKAWMCLQRLFSWFYLVPLWNLGNWTPICQYVSWQKSSHYPRGERGC